MMTKIHFFVLTVLFALCYSSLGQEEEHEDSPLSAITMSATEATTLDIDTNKNKSTCFCGFHGKCSLINGKKTCSCDQGYAEKYGLCKECNCGGKFKSCYFSQIYNTKKCRCDDGYAVKIESYYPNDEKCERCDCGLNGKCNFVGNVKNCTCDPGFSVFVGTCKKCDCGGKFKSCSFSSYSEKRKCECEHGYAVKYGYFSLHENCEVCDCGKNATCEFKDLFSNEKTCRCDPGFVDYLGECRPGICDCGDHGECIFLNGERTCKCDKGYQEYLGKCKACDCGEHGMCGLNFIGSKICNCDSGYVERNGVCTSCYCGENENCKMKGEKKKCLCSEGKKEIRGKCQECDCGENSKFCRLEGKSQRKCDCKKGYYSFLDILCEDCKCGTHGEDCYYDKYGSKVCQCRYGNVKKNESLRCKECDCGAGTLRCSFTVTGKRNCVCQWGYYTSYTDFENGESCVRENSSSVTGWRIATYVVTVIFIVIIIGLLITMADRLASQNRRNAQRR